MISNVWIECFKCVRFLSFVKIPSSNNFAKFRPTSFYKVFLIAWHVILHSKISFNESSLLTDSFHLLIYTNQHKIYNRNGITKRWRPPQKEHVRKLQVRFTFFRFPNCWDPVFFQRFIWCKFLARRDLTVANRVRRENGSAFLT